MTHARQTLRTRFSRSPAAGATAGFLAVFLFFSATAPDTFLSHGSLSSILNSQAVPGIAAIGIALLMISGEFDLSVGSILGVSSLAFLYAAVNGIHILPAALLGLLTGGLLGLANGLLLVWTGIPSFIVTLGTMLVYRGISLTAISGGRIIRYADYAREDPMLRIPFPVLIAAASVLTGILCWTCAAPVRRRLHAFRNPSAPAFHTRNLAALVLLLLPPGLSIYLLLSVLLGGSFGQPLEINFFHLLNGRLETRLPGADYRISILWWFGKER